MHRKNLRALTGAVVMASLLATVACGSEDAASDAAPTTAAAEATTTTEATETSDLWEFTEGTGDDASSDIIEIRVGEDFVGHRVEVEFANNGTDRGDYMFQVEVLDADGKAVENLEFSSLSIDPGQTSVAYGSIFAQIDDTYSLNLHGAFRTNGEQPGENGVALGSATEDASADVTSVDMTLNDSGADLVINVTNGGSMKSDYVIGVAIESPDGTVRFDTVVLFTEGVEPGASATLEGFTPYATPADAVTRVVKVQRTESW